MNLQFSALRLKRSLRVFSYAIPCYKPKKTWAFLCSPHACYVSALFLCIGTFSIANHTACPACSVVPYIAPRSISEHSAHAMTEWITYQCPAEQKNSFFSCTPAYTRSLHADTIAQQLFGCDLQCGNTISIAGSSAPTYNPATDWLADYFYLPNSYTGHFRVNPISQNLLLDCNLYWDMDTVARGLFFRMHAPLTCSFWDLNMTMCDQHTGSSSTGIISPLTTGPNGTYTDFRQFSCEQNTPSDIFASIFSTQIPIPNLIYTFMPLYYNRLCPCRKTIARLADIQADFGWKFLSNDDYHLGLFIRGVAPTGNRPHGTYLFEPIIGNGKHWELGAGLTGHVKFWNSTDQKQSCSFYIDGHITHLFSRTQCRTFDLRGKPWSRYNLAFKIVPDSLSRESIQQIIFSPVANLTAHAVGVSIPLQTTIAALFNYTHNTLQMTVGYEFWHRSCETFTSLTNCAGQPASDRASIYGCASNCTAHCACDNPTFYGELAGPIWSLAGSQSYVAGFGGRALSYSTATIHQEGDPDPTHTYVTRADVDTASAHTRGQSHKLFFTAGYVWRDHAMLPSIHIGTEIEWAAPYRQSCGAKVSTCTSGCCCTNTAFSQWGIWCDAGFAL